MEYTKLGEIAEIIGGQIMTRVKTETPDDETVEIRKVIIPKAISDDGMIDSNILPEEHLKAKADEKKIARENDIIIKLNSPFDSATIYEETAGCIVPSFCAIIRTLNKPGISTCYLQAFLNSQKCKEQLENSVHGSIMTLLTVGKLKEILVPVPEETVQFSIGMTYLETLNRLTTLKEIIRLEKMKNDAFFYELGNEYEQ